MSSDPEGKTPRQGRSLGSDRGHRSRRAESLMNFGSRPLDTQENPVSGPSHPLQSSPEWASAGRSWTQGVAYVGLPQHCCSALICQGTRTYTKLGDTNFSAGPSRRASHAFFRRNPPSPRAEGVCGERRRRPSPCRHPRFVRIRVPQLRKDWCPPTSSGKPALGRGGTTSCPYGGCAAPPQGRRQLRPSFAGHPSLRLTSTRVFRILWHLSV